MYRLAHVTDPHFRSFAGVRPWQLLGKRALGTLNILVSRWRKHRMELLASLGEHVAANAVDHFALTGDVGNVALESEWRAALRWLQAYAGAPHDVTVIPGNHDAYVADVVRAGSFERLFSDYQTSDAMVAAGAASPDSRERYPFLRIRGPLALVALNTCVPTGDVGAWGEIGAAQLERLERVLQSDAVKGKTRVILMHHPPVLHRAGEERNLKDRAAFVGTLARTGAELVLHGHDHRDLAAKVPGPNGKPIFIVGAGSASYTGTPSARARYNVYEFTDEKIVCTTYVHQHQGAGFVEALRQELA